MLAAKKLNLTVEQDLMQHIGFIVMEQLKQYKNTRKELSEEQQCKLAYKIAFNQLIQRVESGEIVDFSTFYTVLEKAQARLFVEREYKTDKKNMMN